MELKNIKSFFTYLVKDKMGMPLGWVRFEKCSDKHYSNQELKRIEDALKNFSYKVAYLLK
jgi:hypothetical protein